ncbi:MBL fold metallo-hydrolase [Chthonobacter rhizosphaerae]|uniref:MBL fold metallo-hydrolase n=1 Tax=Chthonobacter rhizosphaerae TaxID=2735553 RepID=UPI0015EE89AE|nr:MBL fold metallo-hydrolase [Chthonobacter rhizosphaerae]
MVHLGSTLTILEPAAGVLAFYDGRVPGVRIHGDAANWLDDGAFSLGVCTYAIVDGEEALVYDTHISLAHAAIIRRTLSERGVRRITVVLSHWHTDHVAGNARFADCEIVARRLTAELMEANRQRFASDRPPIDPLVMPTRLIDGPDVLHVGSIRVELRPVDIHSEDGLLLLLPETGLLLAGDALEDPITYVDEPDRLARHLDDLRRIGGWPVDRILPNHGDPAVIAAGGYPPDLIGATARYVAFLIALKDDPALAERPLRSVLEPDLASGTLRWFDAYEPVHQHNVEAVLRTRG